MNYQADWAAYFTNVDDQLASIATDLGLRTVAPIAGQDSLVYVSIRMLQPRHDGLSSQEDADQLWKVEDDLVASFDGAAIGYAFAGRLTSAGFRDLYFYTDDPDRMASEIRRTMAAFPPLTYEADHQPDNEWKVYLEFLYPQPQQLQIIQNWRVLEQLQQRGDDLSKSREVFHWIYFRTAADRRQFEGFAQDAGFRTVTCDRVAEPSDRPFYLTVSRVDKVGYDEVNEYTLMLWEKARTMDAKYDGWETSVE